MVSAGVARPVHVAHVHQVGSRGGSLVFPYRVVLVAGESIVAIGALAGAVQLMTGTFTPPVADLAPLGLSSWVLPGLWLCAMVAVPCALAAGSAWRRSPLAPTAVLWASALLAVELVVQIPFVGPSALQATLGAVAAGLAAAAVRSRRLGWPRTWPRPSGTVSRQT